MIQRANLVYQLQDEPSASEFVHHGRNAVSIEV